MNQMMPDKSAAGIQSYMSKGGLESLAWGRVCPQKLAESWSKPHLDETK
jgi:hypothetical protein